MGAGHSAKFGRPEDDGVIEESSLFEVLNEGGGSGGHAEGEGSVVTFEVFVAVPVPFGEAVVVAAPDLDVADASFDESAGDEAFAAEEFSFGLGVDFGVVDAGAFGG